MRFHVQVDMDLYLQICAKMGSFQHFIYTSLKYLLLQLIVKKRFIFSNKVSLVLTKITPLDLFSLAWCKLESRSVVREITSPFIHLFTNFLFVSIPHFCHIYVFLLFTVYGSNINAVVGKEKHFQRTILWTINHPQKFLYSWWQSVSHFLPKILFSTQVFHIPFFVGIGANMTNLERIFYHNKIWR